MISLSTELKEKLINKGASLVGFADLTSIAPEVRDNLPFGISMAMAVDPEIIGEIKNGPTKRYFGEYERLNIILKDLAATTVYLLEEKGYKAKWVSPQKINYDPLLECMVSYDLKTISTPLPHKTAATRAGLGWIGKNAMLITREFGSAVRITTVLTDADLAPDSPVNLSECGECAKCVTACPGHAPSGKNWHVGLPRDEFYDVFACRKTAFQLSRKLDIHETICGICIAVCPWTQKYLKKTI